MPKAPIPASHGPASAQVAPDPLPNQSAFTNPSGDGGPKDKTGFMDWKHPDQEPNVVPDLIKDSEAAVDGSSVNQNEAGQDVNPGGDRPPLADPNTAPETPETTAAEPPEPAAPPQEGDAAPPPEPNGEAARASGVEGILDKYKTPEQLAVGYKEIQKLASQHGRENTELKAELDQLRKEREFIGEHFETDDDGTRRLRPQVAMRRLHEIAPPAGTKTDAQLRQEASTDVRDLLADVVDEDQLDEAVSRAGERVEALFQTKKEQNAREVDASVKSELAKAGAIADRHFIDNPKHQEVIPQVDSFFKRFPPLLRNRMINEGWVDLGELSEAFLAQQQIEPAIREAWQMATDAAGQTLTPSTGGKPTSGPSAPLTKELVDDPDYETKSAILRAGVLPQLLGD